ncbi:MAG TPA: site-2 protease family protein [Actinomycetota bacterium]|nr:site-2 protease family protein [Actinomycetota bacterium]
MSLGVLIFVLAILVVVMIHEAGHFLTAKLFNFKATQFFVGFGPTVWSFRRGETEYGLKALPVGGFVKIVGMDPYAAVQEADQARSYPNKPKWQRAIVIAAGSATHFFVAFVVLMVTAMTLGFPTGAVTNKVAGVERAIAGARTPAASSVIRPGDVIVAVEGKPVAGWAGIRAYIRSHPGQRVTFTLERGESRVTAAVRLGRAAVGKGDRLLAYAPPGEPLEKPPGTRRVIGFLGVSPEPEYAREGFFGAAASAARQTGQLTVLSVKGIGEVFSQVVNGDLWRALAGHGPRNPNDSPLGIVGAGRVAGESVAKGRYLDLIGLIVGFTVFVGLMNLLPLPPLDGGHLAVLVWEAATGRRADIRKLIPVATAVISFFILLFLAVLYLDLARPVQIPF